MSKNMHKYLNIFIIGAVLLSILAFAAIKIIENHKRENDIHFFYCADNGNALQTCVSIASLLENSGKDENINIHIVSFSDNKMSDEHISKISSLSESIKKFKIDFVYFDKSRLNEFNTEHWNKAIMVKLFAPELFPNLNKVIWLDDDTIVLKSLKELYNDKKIDGKYLAGVDVSKEYNKNSAGKNCEYWITAGIGLYNLSEMRKNHVQEDLLSSAKNYQTGDHLRPHCCGGTEEYALTHGMPKEKVWQLPYSYSVMASLFDPEVYDDLDLNDCVMLHFAYRKPWKSSKDINKKIYDKWMYYFEKTPYYTQVQ